MWKDLKGFEWQVADQSEGWTNQFIKSDQSGFLGSSGERKNKENNSVLAGRTFSLLPRSFWLSPLPFYGLPRRLSTLLTYHLTNFTGLVAKPKESAYFSTTYFIFWFDFLFRFPLLQQTIVIETTVSKWTCTWSYLSTENWIQRSVLEP